MTFFSQLNFYLLMTEEELVNPFENFLPELLSVIFSFVNIKDLFSINLVCSHFRRRLLEDRWIWKTQCIWWWNDKGFNKKVKDTGIELVVEECMKFDKRRDWTWFAKALAYEHYKDRDGQRISIGELTSLGHLHKTFGVEVAYDGSNFYLVSPLSLPLSNKGFIF
jgi:hypothetical protein